MPWPARRDPGKVRFRSLFVRRLWTIPEADLAAIANFPVGDLLRPGGWAIVTCRPSEVDVALRLLSGWKLSFGTLAFRRHHPYGKKWRAWVRPKSYILREDLQEVLVVGFRPPYSGRGLKRFATKKRPYLTNFPTRWEWDHYWRFSSLWGYPRLEVWGRSYDGVYDPKRWIRLGPRLDGMHILQSLWLEHSKRCSTPRASSWESYLPDSSS